MHLLDAVEPLADGGEGDEPISQLASPTASEPVRQRTSLVALAARCAGPGHPASTAGLEDEAREHPRELAGLGLVEEPAAQHLGEQEVGFVVDPPETMALIGERPAVDISELLEDGHATGEDLAHGTPLGAVVVIDLELGEGPGQELEGLGAAESGDEVAGEVVGGAEGRVQVRRRGHGHPGHVGDGGLEGVGDDSVALVVEPAPTGPPRHLGVLPRGQRGSPRTAELRESLEHHGPGGHVDPEREGLGGVDHAEEALTEAELHRLTEGGDEPRVVRGDARLQRLEPLMPPERLEVLVAVLFVTLSIVAFDTFARAQVEIPHEHE